MSTASVSFDAWLLVKWPIRGIQNLDESFREQSRWRCRAASCPEDVLAWLASSILSKSRTALCFPRLLVDEHRCDYPMTSLDDPGYLELPRNSPVDLKSSCRARKRPMALYMWLLASSMPKRFVQRSLWSLPWSCHIHPQCLYLDQRRCRDSNSLRLLRPSLMRSPEARQRCSSSQRLPRTTCYRLDGLTS